MLWYTYVSKESNEERRERREGQGRGIKRIDESRMEIISRGLLQGGRKEKGGGKKDREEKRKKLESDELKRKREREKETSKKRHSEREQEKTKSYIKRSVPWAAFVGCDSGKSR